MIVICLVTTSILKKTRWMLGASCPAVYFSTVHPVYVTVILEVGCLSQTAGHDSRVTSEIRIKPWE